ncbi:MAG: hypothetical protein ACYTGQ_16750, partial [Planctomycetota bacterium]
GFNRQRFIDIHQRLFNSGRFLRHDVTLRYLSEDRQSALLLLDLMEAEMGPKLTEPLSETDAILMKSRDWLVEPANWDRDLELIIEDPSGKTQLRVYYNAERGWMIHMSVEDNEGFMPFLDFAARGFKGQVDLLLLDSSKRFKVEFGDYKAQLKVEAGPLDDLSGEKQYGIGFGMSASTRSDGTALTILPHFAPVGFLDKMNQEARSIRVENGVLELEGPKAVMRADALTGELTKIRTGGDGQTVVTINFQEGVMEDAFESLLSRGFDAGEGSIDHPFGALAKLVVLEAVKKSRLTQLLEDTERQALEEIIRQVVAPEDFAFMEEKKEEKDQDKFEIPIEPSEFTSMVMNMWLLFFGPQVDEAFERGTWPWTLSREMVMMMSGPNVYSQGEMWRLGEMEKIGPLGYLCIAKGMSYVNPMFSGAFARKGLTTMTLQRFQADCEVLLLSEGKAAPALRAMLRRMQKVDPSRLPPESMIRRFVEALKIEPDIPFEKNQQAQEAVWELFKDDIETALKRLGDPSVPQRVEVDEASGLMPRRESGGG